MSAATPRTIPAPTPTPRSRADRKPNLALWALTGLSLLTALLVPLVTGEASTRAALLLTIPFAFIHGIRRYGVRQLLTFFVVTFVVSNFFEDLSIITGFPFGDYHYTGAPKLLEVPIQIGPIYFGLGYLAWLTASALLDNADSRLGRAHGRTGTINLFALPALAAALMTMFDLGSDSISSTVSHVWIWEHGGGVFGVPYTNYLGWWFVTYLFFQIFALILARPGLNRGPQHTTGLRHGSLAQPALIYTGLGLASITYFTAAHTTRVTDATGVAWNTAALNETMMTINIFGLIVVGLLALTKIARGDTTRTTP
ncbi:carotenoid biosynthesis protein [Streptomyces sp. NPDC005329]|uniref:carotenoid biosynthesis protein n=1 Tax=Streptomyces sp. NPDC005329 TaxID=3157034 RepID=UPI0033BC7654